MARAICRETVLNAHGVYIASPHVQEVDEASLAARPDAFTVANLAADDEGRVKATAAQAERTAAKPAARRRAPAAKKKV